MRTAIKIFTISSLVGLSGSFNSKESIKDIQIYPSPVKSGEMVNVQFKNIDDIQLKTYIFNMKGEMIYDLEIPTDSGRYTKKIPSFIHGDFIIFFKGNNTIIKKRIKIIK